MMRKKKLGIDTIESAADRRSFLSARISSEIGVFSPGFYPHGGRPDVVSATHVARLHGRRASRVGYAMDLDGPCMEGGIYPTT